MQLINFLQKFPTEDKCKEHFKEHRIKTGITCKKCGGKDHKWVEKKEQFECKNTKCRFRTTLKSGTMLHGSKLTYQYWYIAMWLITSTKKSFSALELQRQLDHKYYEPIWAMLHKIRKVMGERDAQYTFSGEVEMDEGFFETVLDKEEREEQKNQPLKRGRGSSKQSIAQIMVEFESVQKPVKNSKGNNKHKIQRAIKFIKMNKIGSLKTNEITGEVERNIDKDTVLSTDNSTSYGKLKELVKQHIPKVVSKDEIIDHLPWVHVVISNIKRDLLSRHHSISKSYFQLYLNEFCYKFNRRYMNAFDRLLTAGVSICWC